MASACLRFTCPMEGSDDSPVATSLGSDAIETGTDGASGVAVTVTTSWGPVLLSVPAQPVTAIDAQKVAMSVQVRRGPVIAAAYCDEPAVDIKGLSSSCGAKPGLHEGEPR